RSLLSQTNTDGVQSSLLLSLDGALLACSGYTADTDAACWPPSPPTCGTPWSAAHPSGLQDMTVVCTNGSLYIAYVSSILLVPLRQCHRALGMLRLKAAKLADSLRDSISQIYWQIVAPI
uniref:F-box/WD repeat-containing protein 7 n=1 Tax=Macrostomum lignano TaxID=282301 RepID=A0A1I8F6M1_9PLAT